MLDSVPLSLVTKPKVVKEVLNGDPRGEQMQIMTIKPNWQAN